jgi:tRNA (guanosine-2'-O-)-methyltransferase
MEDLKTKPTADSSLKPFQTILTSGAKGTKLGDHHKSSFASVPLHRHKYSNLVCVLEHCKNPQNLGSIIRNVDALGIGALFIVTDNPTWLTYFSTIKMGRNQTIPPQCKKLHKMLRTTSKACNQWINITAFPSSEDLIQFLNTNHFANVATSPHQFGKTNINLDDAYILDEKIAIWFGSENNGLSPTAIQNAKYCIQIPMCGIVESMNLASCTAIVLHYFTMMMRK